MTGQTYKQTYGLTDGRTDRYIILPLKGFDPIPWVRMCCAHLWAVRIISNKQYRRPVSDSDRQTERQISLTGTHWDP